ncbi:MAG: hypothetical protein RX316_05330 [bacterium]|nr:hypothetical protein [bacterium]
MTPLHAFRTDPIDPDQSQALDAVLRARCAPGGPALLRMGLGATEGLLFGRYQPIAKSAWGRPDVQRRITGGRLVPVGPGILEVSVAAPGLTDLTIQQRPITSDLILNRYVRGVLRGLERLRLNVMYPGRDLITLEKRAVGHVAFDIDEAGRPLVQFHLAWSTSLAEAAPRLADSGGRLEDRDDLLAPEGCITLSEALGATPKLERVLEALREGFAEHVGATIPIEPLPEEVRAQADSAFAETFAQEAWRADRTPPASLDRTARVPSQLGSFHVALALEDDSRLGQVCLLGEFLADWPAVAALEEALPGCLPEWSSIAKVVDRVLDTPPHVVLGLGPRRTIPDTIVRAIGQRHSPST